MMKFRDFVTEVLSVTSEIANKNTGRVSWTLKDDYNQVLTETDKEIGEYIIDRIKAVFPRHSIIDEEAGVVDKKSDFVWVVDPIDGTSNFAFGVPTYGTLIGLLYNGVPIGGALALPEFGKIYCAEKGKGTRCNGGPVFVTDETDLSRCLISYSIDANKDKPDKVSKECRLAARLINSIRSLRMSNSVFDAAMVLEGKYGAFMMKNSKIWDNVALQVLIEEAGGVYTDFSGRPIDYSAPFLKIGKNFTFLMASPKIHKRLQEIINRSRG
jgi:myo-inositol-1(or 4)-monophosphatase